MMTNGWRQSLRNWIELLPLGIGSRVIIPVVRTVIRFAPSRLKGTAVLVSKIHGERREARKIFQAVRKPQFKKAIIVYDNLVSPPTYGDYLFVVMLARYIALHGCPVSFYIVSGDYRIDWDGLSDDEKRFHLSQQEQLARTILAEFPVTIQIAPWSEVEARIENDKASESYIPFRDRVFLRTSIYDSTFNVLNHLVSFDRRKVIEAFLISFDEIVSRVQVALPVQRYITWPCRYSQLWAPERNTGDEEFLRIHESLASRYPCHAIMVVSDEIGCARFKKIARCHRLDCLFSKDYSNSFVGDGALILGSDFYFQVRSGGIGVFAVFSRIPYEFFGAMANEVEWQKGKATSWANDRQIFYKIPGDDKSVYLPTCQHGTGFSERQF